MSEHAPITPNKNDKNVLVPFSNGRIEVMSLSDVVDDLGHQMAYKLEDDGQAMIIKGGVPEAFSDKVQEYYANKLAMDRNPTPEQLERGTPPKVITDLGDIALESAMATPLSAEGSNNHNLEQESHQEEGLDFQIVSDQVGTLRRGNEANRHLPELERKHNIAAYITKKATTTHEQFREGRINQETYSAITNALLGAASNPESIGAVVDSLLDVNTLDADERADLSLHSSSISQISERSGMEAERARIGLASSLIATSERILSDNGGVANSRYKAMVAFIAGLSTQINDSNYSDGFASGALNKLRNSHK